MPKRGGSRGQKKPSLSNLSRQSVKAEQREQYVKELMGESDRASALVAAAELDTVLTVLLMGKFAKLSELEKDEMFYGKRAPLSDFASRIFVAYGLGVISQGERDDLNRIRRVRNAFAHSFIPLTFGHELVVKECEALAYREIRVDDAEVTFGIPKLRYLLTVMELRWIFYKRAVKGAKEYGKLIDDVKVRKNYLSEIDRILKPDA